MALVVMCEKHEDVRLCIKTKLIEIYTVKCPCIVTKNTQDLSLILVLLVIV